MKRQAVVTLFGLVALLWGLGNAADAEILYEDEHGVRVEYTATDTGHYTRCTNPQDENYTDKKIKVWEVRLKITNGPGRRIKPDPHGIAWVSVDPHQGSTLGYFAYDRVGNLYRIDGHGDQNKLMFHIATLVYAIPPRRTLSSSTYLYLYEDQKPMLTEWHFGGYRFLDDKPETPQASARQAPADQTTTAPNQSNPSRQTPARSGPSGSLILLVDVSGSMDGAKLASAKQAAIDAIRKAIRSKTEIAVLAFEGNCAHPLDSSVGFTRNETDLVAFVNGLGSPRRNAAGHGTGSNQPVHEAAQIRRQPNSDDLAAGRRG